MPPTATTTLTTSVLTEDPPLTPLATAPVTPPVPLCCACGCGFPLTPGMRVHLINGHPYALGCVSAPVLLDEPDPEPDPHPLPLPNTR